MRKWVFKGKIENNEECIDDSIKTQCKNEVGRREEKREKMEEEVEEEGKKARMAEMTLSERSDHKCTDSASLISCGHSER
uniref:Uncharacterized protein n=1 Tax=Caenorhabditis tropicalis TaxID=1561998 RepID=A0A1I7U1R7_9PELO